jgi:DnaJ-class molecular chaperone
MRDAIAHKTELAEWPWWDVLLTCDVRPVVVRVRSTRDRTGPKFSATTKGINQMIGEIKCEACGGTGVVPVIQPAPAGRRIYPPPCSKCQGKGRVEKTVS